MWEVNETLSINWEDPNPRVLWDGARRRRIKMRYMRPSALQSRPCKRLMDKSMLGEAAI